MSDDTYSFTAHIVVMADGRTKDEAADAILEHCLDGDIACSLREVDKQQQRIAELERGRDIQKGNAERWEALAMQYKREIERLRAALMSESERADLLSKDHYRKRIEELEDKLHRIEQWCNAYPRTVFIEPTKKQWAEANKVLEAHRPDCPSLTAISGSNMRHVVEGIAKIAALREDEPQCSVHGIFSREDICDECKALREDEDE